MEDILKVDIAIPAFNEEGNIGGLLRDISGAEEQPWFEIGNIYVISDCSSDRTDEIVLQKSKQDDRIKLIRKPERKGKWDSINLAISGADADILVLLDADVRLASKEVIKNLITPFLQDGAALVGGNPTPERPGFDFNVARQAAYFSWILLDEIKKGKPSGFYLAHGRILALCRDLYKCLVLPDSSADDQYIYFSCIEQGRKFMYAEESVVYYALPGKLGDYLRQSIRFRFSVNMSKNAFCRSLVEKETRINSKFTVLPHCFLRHPLAGLMWTMSYLIGKVKFAYAYRREKHSPGMWEVVKTTK